MTVQQKDFTFLSRVDEISLVGTMIYPEHPVGIIQFLHGMAEHKERYYGAMRYFAAQGYATIIHNHRGHGNCALLGDFGKGRGEGAIIDANVVSELAKKEFPDLPLFLFGHSMGSLIARCCLQRYDDEYQGVFLCGAPYTPAAVVGLAKVLIDVKTLFSGEHHRSGTMAGLVTGAFNKKIKNPTSPNQWITYNPENVASYDADPLCGFYFTLNGYRALMYLMGQAYAKKNWAKANPTLPVHFISGADDPCHGGLKTFQKAVGGVAAQGYPTTYRLFDDMRHEILLEKENLTVYQHILETLKEMQQ